jgi:integrase
MLLRDIAIYPAQLCRGSPIGGIGRREAAALAGQREVFRLQADAAREECRRRPQREGGASVVAQLLLSGLHQPAAVSIAQVGPSIRLRPAGAHGGQGNRDIRGAKLQGARTGNWLTKRQAEALINRPDTTTLKGRRDCTILAVMIGCGLRREEVARLEFADATERRPLVHRGHPRQARPHPHGSMPSWVKAALDEWAGGRADFQGWVIPGVNKGDRLTGDSRTSQVGWGCVEKYSNVALHDLRRTYAKLAHNGGAKLDQIQLSLGHTSLTTTERYLGVRQELNDAPCDYLRLGSVGSGIKVPETILHVIPIGAESSLISTQP